MPDLSREPVIQWVNHRRSPLPSIPTTCDPGVTARRFACGTCKQSSAPAFIYSVGISFSCRRSAPIAPSPIITVRTDMPRGRRTRILRHSRSRPRGIGIHAGVSEAATWVREIHPELFSPFDLALFKAFFGRTEDISDPKVLEQIAGAVGLEPSALRAALSTGRYRSIVLQEFLEATNRGIHGVPTVLIPAQAPLVGAVLYTDLRRAVESAFASRLARSGVDPASGNVIIQEGSEAAPGIARGKSAN